MTILGEFNAGEKVGTRIAVDSFIDNFDEWII
jgi:hypothetical protein